MTSADLRPILVNGQGRVAQSLINVIRLRHVGTM
ncbi:hypothetical protein FB480_10256 [Agrobacterium vitis]|nr:hypothetical protein FB480_10256 [Agrobacterium vitis]